MGGCSYKEVGGVVMRGGLKGSGRGCDEWRATRKWVGWLQSRK